MSDTHQPTPNPEDLFDLTPGPNQVNVILEDPVRDGADTWIVGIHVPSLNLSGEITVTGDDVEEAMNQAAQWVSLHATDLRAMAVASRLN